MSKFLLGYEESYGYVAGRHVRDKDGVSAAMLICEMAAYLKEYDMTLADRLSELYEEFDIMPTDRIPSHMKARKELMRSSA